MPNVTSHPSPAPRPPTRAVDDTPWYRQPWPWLLMIMPATAVVAGFFTWWLAATSNNSLVVDDYYREGRAINRTLARDAQAAQMGLRARLEHSGATVRVVLQASQPPAAWPEALQLRLVHATEAELDAALRLAHHGAGHYEADGVLPASGHWHVHLEDEQRQWRLVKRADRFDQPLDMNTEPSPPRITP